MDEQRKRVYGYRQRILEGGNCKQLVLDMIRQQIDARLDQFLARDYGTETFAKWAGKELSVEFDARDFRGLDFQDAQRLCHGPGRAEGRGPDHGRPGGEPSHRRRRQERLELGGPGQVRQHALAHWPSATAS